MKEDLTKNILLFSISFILGGLLLFPRMLYSEGTAPEAIRNIGIQLHPFLGLFPLSEPDDAASEMPKKSKENSPEENSDSTASDESALSAANALPSLALEGIIYDPAGDSQVLINGQIRNKGQRIQGFKIIKIEEKRVILKKDNQHYSLSSKSGLRKVKAVQKNPKPKPANKENNNG